MPDMTTACTNDDPKRGHPAKKQKKYAGNGILGAVAGWLAMRTARVHPLKVRCPAYGGVCNSTPFIFSKKDFSDKMKRFTAATLQEHFGVGRPQQPIEARPDGLGFAV
jgi:hypothetical protein